MTSNSLYIIPIAQIAKKTRKVKNWLTKVKKRLKGKRQADVWQANDVAARSLPITLLSKPRRAKNTTIKTILFTKRPKTRRVMSWRRTVKKLKKKRERVTLSNMTCKNCNLSRNKSATKVSSYTKQVKIRPLQHHLWVLVKILVRL